VGAPASVCTQFPFAAILTEDADTDCINRADCMKQCTTALYGIVV